MNTKILTGGVAYQYICVYQLVYTMFNFRGRFVEIKKNSGLLFLIFRMYGHPQGGRFVPNIAPIPGQSYVYHPSSGVHPGLQHAQIPPSSTLNHTVSAYTQPQTAGSIASSAGYHPSPPAVPTPIQPQYIAPVESLHPILVLFLAC